MKSLKITIIAITLLFYNLGNATIYPVRFGSNTDLIVVHDSVTDLLLRLELFKRAQHSIEIITHTHTSGDNGMAVTVGLREALSRGVQVKYLYEKIATIAAGDMSNNAIAFLMDKNLSQNAEVIAARPLEKFKSPFSFSDLFHQKIIIIDRGTPNEIIMTGGRNHDELNLKSADLSFIFRRVNGSSESKIMDDLKTVFDNTWTLARRYYSLENQVSLNNKQNLLLTNYKPTSLFQKISEKGQQIIKQTELPATNDQTLQEFQFRPESFRLVTNDALETIVSQKEKKLKKDKANVNDDITTYLSSMMEYASRLEINSYIMMLPKPLMDGMKNIVARGGEVQYYTNNQETYSRLVPIRFMGKIAAGYNYETHVELVNDSQPDKVQVLLFDAAKGDRSEIPVEYSHRKLALFEIPKGDSPENYKHFSWLGSYNFTYSSAKANDEMGVMVQDKKLYNYLSEMNKLEGENYHVQLSEEESRENLKKGKFMRAVCRGVFKAIF